ncbi:uncharacterized protein BO87DRAFT_375409 [Aspergillus neoniger CBS 115656]|uniref:Uncharacterized protein n=1 Tax=Aspergillus neoniger (strain CBS 115656) TaxID=1448310 RepID=A0A318Z6G6_ASPNB|nr:hypothetical protein BO87DRAFT_375409 [Aspergillus neoniger CBS 115656]PYH35788.1 hypothetical protein BO87DRAFT_375409 [Aspergillus neoniger CBS 115656]
MRIGFVFCAISTLVILPLGQCRPLDASCCQLQALDTRLESLLHFMDQAHTEDQNVYPNDRIEKLHGARPLIEYSSDSMHQMKEQHCSRVDQGDETISRRQTTHEMLLETLLETLDYVLKGGTDPTQS